MSKKLTVENHRNDWLVVINFEGERKNQARGKIVEIGAFS
jgi:hypothetical protein